MGERGISTDDAFPTPFLMESIIVIVPFPFLTAAFLLFFTTALEPDCQQAAPNIPLDLACLPSKSGIVGRPVSSCKFPGLS
jgi:hypothetical protein